MDTGYLPVIRLCNVMCHMQGC